MCKNNPFNIIGTMNVLIMIISGFNIRQPGLNLTSNILSSSLIAITLRYIYVVALLPEFSE